MAGWRAPGPQALAALLACAACGRLAFDPIDAASGSLADTGSASPPDAAPRFCTPSYASIFPSHPDRTYRIQTVAATWDNAVAACAADGAYLAIADDAAELAAFGTHAAPGIWLGATDRVTEAVWITVLDTPAPYLDWAPGEPNNQALLQHCLEVYGFGNGEMDDYECDMPVEYICECAP